MGTASKIVLITGANSGVGLASSGVIVKASPQYHVIMASRIKENGEKAVAEIRAMGDIKGTVSTVQLDQTDPESVSRAAEEVERQFGHLDVLVNNAAIARGDDDVKKSMDETFVTNVSGPAIVAEAFMPLLLKGTNAYSIYVSSVLGSLARAADPSSPDFEAQHIVYRTSKAALNMWALQEHKTYNKQGVKTFLMCPGFVVSNLRGKDEESRSGGGVATSPEVSGQTMLSIIEGQRDADVGKFVHKDGLYPW